MNDKKGQGEAEKTGPACVVRVIDNTKVAINRGARNGIVEGMRFVVYRLSGEEIKDPFTKESLGPLAIVKGTGKVINVQETMSVLESDQKERTERTTAQQTPGGTILSIYPFMREVEVAFERKPFDNPGVGDLIKRV